MFFNNRSTSWPLGSTGTRVRHAVLLGVLMTLPTVTKADLITVCAVGCDYIEIQAAIDASQDGDVIEIGAGVWEPAATLDPRGRAVTLRGTISNIDGALETVIDGRGKIRIIECQNGEEIDTIFENLVVRNGRSAAGGGMRNRGGSNPSIKGCVFLQNTAVRGGGVYNEESATPSFEDCRFEENIATGSGSSGDGGAICNATGYPNLIDCLFIANHANDDGGAVFGGVSLATSCSFIGNSAIDDGGAIFGGSPRFLDCSFSGNTAGDGGGCMYTYQDAVRLERCSIEDNFAGGSGGGILTEGSPLIIDVVMRGNSATVSAGAILVLGTSSSPRISNSVICGNGTDQLIGFWTDQGGNSISVDCPEECIGDLNEDEVVNGIDLGLLLLGWNSEVADLNSDGLADGGDVGILLSAWGNCSSP